MERPKVERLSVELSVRVVRAPSTLAVTWMGVLMPRPSFISSFVQLASSAAQAAISPIVCLISVLFIMDSRY